MKIEGQRAYGVDALQKRTAGATRTVSSSSEGGPDLKASSARISEESMRMSEARAERVGGLRDRYLDGAMAPQPQAIARSMLAADER